jgi:hypothetical protein
MITAYLHPLYAESLSEYGTPRQLTRCGAWILQRQVQDFPYFDAMGMYPLFSCTNWAEVHLDLEELEGQLVSISAVTDPFGEYDPEYLRSCFRDVIFPFKQHFIVDLNQPLKSFVHSHHRRKAKKALEAVTVEQCVNLDAHLDDWVRLYGHLIEKHHIKGLSAFSRNSFKGQFQVPGMVAFRAVNEGETVGMLLWYIQKRIGYYHLGAYSPRGYELGASFALFWIAIQYLAESGLHWLSIGAGAGTQNNGQDGLTRFKRGWSTGIRTAYFCGRILDQRKYQEIVASKALPPVKFFPAYRFGEF